MSDLSDILEQYGEPPRPTHASATGGWDAPASGYLTELLKSVLAAQREKGLELAEKGRRPWRDQRDEIVGRTPIAGRSVDSYTAFNEGRPWAGAGNAALAGLESLMFVPGVGQGIAGLVNRMGPGKIAGATKIGASEAAGNLGVRSTVPEEMDAALKAYVEATQAHPGALAAFLQAGREYPEKIANAVRLHKEMGTQTAGRGATRNRQLDTLAGSASVCGMPEQHTYQGCFAEGQGRLEGIAA